MHCGRNADETSQTRKTVTETVFASGILVPEDQYDLTAENEGYLVQLNFKEGDTVKQGNTLADGKITSNGF